MPLQLTAENVFTALRMARLKLTSPPCSFVDLVTAIYFIFLAHPFRRRRKRRHMIRVARKQDCARQPLNPDRKHEGAVNFVSRDLPRVKKRRAPSMPSRCWLQIINRAPIAGCDERGRSFPRPATGAVVGFFFAAPK